MTAVLSSAALAEAIGRDVWRLSTCRRPLPYYRLHNGACRVDSGAHRQLLYQPEFGTSLCHRLISHDGPCTWPLPDGQIIERQPVAPVDSQALTHSLKAILTRANSAQ